MRFRSCKHSLCFANAFGLVCLGVGVSRSEGRLFLGGKETFWYSWEHQGYLEKSWHDQDEFRSFTPSPLNFLLDIWEPAGELSIWKGIACSWENLNLSPMWDMGRRYRQKYKRCKQWNYAKRCLIVN